MKRLLILILMTQAAVSCKVADKIPPQKRLYGGASVSVVRHDSLAGGEVPEFKTLLETLPGRLPIPCFSVTRIKWRQLFPGREKEGDRTKGMVPEAPGRRPGIRGCLYGGSECDQPQIDTQLLRLF
ncbi:MAG: hypothetical protein LRY55_09705 [Leadbetterella sp.]|nr:hypothetical protein [Leadbetterella sp.]